MNLKITGTSDHRARASGAEPGNPWLISADDFPIDGSGDEKLWFAAQYAILAPSNHNTQPWHFRISGLELDLCADRTRALPISDPRDRELTISCGAALFHLRMALQYFGYSCRVDYYPDARDPDLLARVHLGTRSETDSDDLLLFLAILQRRTTRLPFRDLPVPPELLASLQAEAQKEDAWLTVLEREEDRGHAADVVAEADRRQWANGAFRAELAEWVRPEGTHTHDGLSVSSQDLGSLLSHAGPMAIRTFNLGKSRAAKDREIVTYSPILAILGTDADEPVAWLSAGQALARVLLKARSEEVSASFLNQPIQVPELRNEITDMTGREGFPQILLRMGYGPTVKATPRRSVSEVLIRTARETPA